MNIFRRLIFLGLFFLNLSMANAQSGVLIPFYIYPTASAIQPLINAKTQHPAVPMRVILNPNSGVGPAIDPNYATATATLIKNGIQVVGYVNTEYNVRPIASVMAEILLWSEWYKPSGIFLDAMGASSTYYAQLKTYINSLGMNVVVGNAGQNVDISYDTLVDSVVIANSGALPNLSNYCNWNTTSVPKTTPAFILYDIATLPINFITQAESFIGWIYVTNGANPNPWGSLPPYFENLITLLDQSLTTKTGSVVPFYIYPTAAAIQPLLTAKAANPITPLLVVLNPNSGVGSSQNADYVNAIKALKNQGVTVLGYVYTSYGQRAISAVENEIEQWINWYQPDGIFLDEMALNHPYYSAITAFNKNLGLIYTVGNPGANIDVSASNDVDIVMAFENSSLPVLSNYTSWKIAGVPKSKLGFFSYNIPILPTTAIAPDAQVFGWMYMTPGAGSNPYITFPPYFETMMSDLNQLNNK